MSSPTRTPAPRSVARVGGLLVVLALLFPPGPALAAAGSNDDPGEATGTPTPDGPATPDPTPSPTGTATEPTGTSTVRMARATWDTGWFQAEVHRLLLERLGYEVTGPRTMENRQFYDAAAAGEVDLWVNGWFPLHEPQLDEQRLEVVGTQVEQGALQGYFVDRATAQAHDITGVADLQDPEVAARFDVDGDGRADLTGCNPGWGCEAVIEHHLDAYDLRDTVEHVQGDYSPLMTEVVDRHEAGDPVLFYTWTPNWTVGELEPGTDVRWLQVPFPSLPPDQRDSEDRTTVGGLSGCPDDPCRTGWAPNDIRAVGNRAFLEANRPARRLLEAVEIPLADILAQNARMVAGEGDTADIVAHAEEWIAGHEGQVREWIAHADPSQVPAVDPGSRPDGAGGAGDVLRVATRPFPPLVLYEGQQYRGFAVDLWDQIAALMGVEYELYGVNTVAKQLDEVDRGAADVALSAIGITVSREQTADFSHPYFRTGLQVMVGAGDDGGLLAHGRRFLDAILLSQVPLILLLFAVALLLSAHVMWWVERQRNTQFPPDYRNGIWESLWWSVVTVTTVGYGDKTPKGRVGKGVAVLWMVLGYFVFAAFTASVTSSLAVGELRGEINGPSDLHGHVVATVRDSAASSWLVSQGIGPVHVDDLDEAYTMLEEGEVDALVFDAPALQFHATREGQGRVRTVGPEFDQLEYGIGTAEDSQLREEINRALLELVESGVYDQLHAEWFGDAEGMAAG